MPGYSCKIPNCKKSNKISQVRKFIFSHYVEHTRTEINNLADALNIPNAYHENKYSLINAIIEKTKEEFCP